MTTGQKPIWTASRASTVSPSVITVTLSPAWDLTITAAHLDLGRSHRVDPAVGRLGGKGVNVARVLASIGVGAYVQGPVARAHWPECSIATARRTGAENLAVDAAPEAAPIWDLTETSARLRRSYAVVEESGRATVLNERAAQQTPAVWDALTQTITRRLTEPSVSVLVLSGSTPADCPDDFHSKIVSAAHTAGVEVIVDTSGPGLLSAARAGADWVKPNAEELNELFAHEDTTTSARELVRTGAHNVLVSRGEDGMVLVDESGQRSRARLRRVLHGNPTGAGDASVAALARCLAAMSQGTKASTQLADDDVDVILTEAVALSASAVLMPQAGRIHPDWQRLRHDVVITRTRA